jgi:putative Mg2+ transporter-C (MgtC) family protein
MIPEQPIILIGRILLAAFLGGLIGIERDVHGRSAGLRTNLLVGMGASVFMIISLLMAVPDPKILGSGIIRVDPGRIAAQIVTGIGFIGAGTIIKEGLTIRGLTTAACLWVVAGVGMATGAGYYSIAVVTTAIAFGALQFLVRLEKYYPKHTFGTLILKTKNDIDISLIIKTVKSIENVPLRIMSCNLEKNYDTGLSTAEFSVRFKRKDFNENLADSIVSSFEKTQIPLTSIYWKPQ